MQLFRRFFRFYNEINVYGTTSGRSNDDYKCFIMGISQEAIRSTRYRIQQNMKK